MISPLERGIYKVMGIDAKQEMSAGQYVKSILLFSLLGFVFVFLIQILQGVLPANPRGLSGVSLDVAFNTIASFVSNTNWQAYAGETTMSYLTQMRALTMQNFASAATGISILFVVCKGFIRKEINHLGNFWSDLVRIVLYVLLPLSIIVSSYNKGYFM